MHDFELEPAPGPAVTAPPEAAEVAGPVEAPAGRAPLAVQTEATLLHLQRTAGNASVVQMLAEEREEAEAGQSESSPVHEVIGGGGGTALDPATRDAMESSFGQDFGDVRVHTDATASASAESVGANAYTVGNDIVFRSGHFDPATPTGQRTLAHELSHVVQQRSGPVDGTDAPGGIRLSDPGNRFERAADATAEHVLGGGGGAPAAATPAPSLQRETEDEDEVDVQRAVEPAEEEQDEEMAG